MSLMTLVRLFAGLFLGWTLVALGIGAMGGGSPSHPAPLPHRVEPSRLDALLDIPGSERPDLLDRSTGLSTPIRLPEDDQWTNVSVSPWRDSDGDWEVVGRWVNRGAGAFCGMGSFRLSDGAVLSRIPMEILPIGRPCWVPGQDRTILFPAGDGQLHRCRLLAPEVEGGISRAAEDTSGQTPPTPVSWKVPPPGLGSVFLSEPVWSSDSRLRKWVIVGLSRQGLLGPKTSFQPPKLWWLEMSDQADSIVAAGRLTVPASVEGDGDDGEERFPNVAVGPDGTVQLVYLTRRVGEKMADLRSAELQFDAETGRPRLTPGPAGSRTLGEGIGTAPLLVSADGTKVFALDGSGQVRTFSLAAKSE